MKKPRDRSNRDIGAVCDMKLAAERALKFLEGFTEGEFYDDEKTQAAVIRQIEIIGEASKQVSQPFREKHSSVPWRKIARMRDRVIHNYNDVELAIVWDTCQSSLKELIKTIDTQIQKSSKD